MFRVAYVGLEEPAAVTVLGRVIGYYIPASVAIDERFLAGLRPGEPPSHEAPERTRGDGDAAVGAVVEPAHPSPSGASQALKPTAGMTQAEKDRVLRAVSGKDRKGT